MTKKIIWIIAGIIIILLTFLIIYLICFFQSSSPRLSYISRISQLEIPSTASIVEYQFGINLFGIDPFFAKLELNQEDYNILRRYFQPSIYAEPDAFVERSLTAFLHMQQRTNYVTVYSDDIIEIGWRERITSRSSIFPVRSSKTINSILITTSENEYFLYVYFI